MSMRVASSNSYGIDEPYCVKMKIAYGVANVTSTTITDQVLSARPH